MSTTLSTDARDTSPLEEKLPTSPDSKASLYGVRERWCFLGILVLIFTLNIVNRITISVVLDPIKHEFHLSDTMLGVFGGFAFAVFYALGGIPFARWADRGDRRTVLAVALIAWSTMTVLCGTAQLWWQLLLARVGVGLATAGSESPTQSLIADYFPVERRTTAIAIWNASGNVGYMVALGLGGYVAAKYGWRQTFFVIGIPGLLVAIVTRLGLPEPRRTLGFPAAKAPLESLFSSLFILKSNKSFVCALAGIAMYTFFGYGFSLFLPTFMLRSLHASLHDVGVTYGVALTCATVLGAIGGGWLADRLGAIDIRWQARLPSLACACAVPIYWIALTGQSFVHFVAISCSAEALIAAGIPASYTAIHAVCGDRRRAMAFAIMYLSTTLFGMGLGPLTVGALSDLFGSMGAQDALRYALAAMLLPMLLAAIAFQRLSRFLTDDAAANSITS